MITFGKRLNELMIDGKIDAKMIAEYLGLGSMSTVYMWRNGEKRILLNNAIRLAGIFNCSIDYLMGLSDVIDDRQYIDTPPFGVRLKEVLNEQKSSQNKLLKYAHISNKSLNNWLNNKGVPHIDSIYKIAKYLDVSIDYLVGREE